MLEVLPRSRGKSMTLQEKAELFDMYHRWRSAAVVAHHFKIYESNVRTITKKEKICEAIVVAAPVGMKIL